MDRDSVSIFSDHLSLDQTLPLTIAEALDHRHISVVGCYFVKRDLLDQVHSVLDSCGDWEYWHETHAFGIIPKHECRSRIHRGSRWLPFGEFAGDARKPETLDHICKGCRNEMRFQARERVAQQQNRQLRKWTRHDHRPLYLTA